MPDMFRESAWPGVLLWATLFVSDYALTLVCARLYKSQDKVAFEGSFELNPYYQGEIDSRKVFSTKFLITLLFTMTLIWAVWRQFVFIIGWMWFYSLMLGALVLLQLVVHVRHLRNYIMFSRLINNDGIKGHIYYSKAITLRISAIDLVIFSVFFLILSALTNSWFILGGSLICAATGYGHFKRSRNPAA